MSFASLSRRLLPLADRVIVHRAAQKTKSAAGVILPESAVQKLNEGVVVAVGPGGRTSTGQVIPVSVKEGDKVLLPEYGGNIFKVDNQEFTLYRDAEILAVIQDK